MDGLYQLYGVIHFIGQRYSFDLGWPWHEGRVGTRDWTNRELMGEHGLDAAAIGARVLVAQSYRHVRVHPYPCMLVSMLHVP